MIFLETFMYLYNKSYNKHIVQCYTIFNIYHVFYLFPTVLIYSWDIFERLILKITTTNTKV